MQNFLDNILQSVKEMTSPSKDDKSTLNLKENSASNENINNKVASAHSVQQQLDEAIKELISTDENEIAVTLHNNQPSLTSHENVRDFLSAHGLQQQELSSALLIAGNESASTSGSICQSSSDPTDKEIIEHLLAKASGLELPSDLVFVLSDKKMTAKELIDLIGNEDFTNVFRGALSGAQVDVRDTSSKIFINLIRYVYGEEMIKDLSDLSATYAAAIAYSVDVMDRMLLDHANAQLTIYNSSLIYDQYLKIGDDVQEYKLFEVLNIINLHAYLALLSEYFVKISIETLVKVLQSDQLFIREKDVYYACMKWMKAQVPKEDTDGRLALFNKIKHLIRFPIMTSKQFFSAERVAKSIWENQADFDPCPAKSGLFSVDELKEFEKYFESNDATALTVNYNVNQRCKMSIGQLNLVRNEENEFKFQMKSTVDDSFFYEVTPDAVSSFSKYGDNHKSVVNMACKEIKSPKCTDKSRLNSFVCNDNSIRVFRVHVTGSSSGWDYGCHLMIIENGKTLSAFYNRYTVDNTFGYYDYHPTFEMKKGHQYTFRFVTPGEGVEESELRLDNIYSQTEEGPKLDVKLTIVKGLSWSHAHKILFLYK